MRSSAAATKTVERGTLLAQKLPLTLKTAVRRAKSLARTKISTGLWQRFSAPKGAGIAVRRRQAKMALVFVFKN